MDEPPRKPSLAAHLLVWLAVPAGEWLIGRGAHPSPAAWQWLVEAGAFAALALLQWRFAGTSWPGTLLGPAFVVLLSGLFVYGPTDSLLWQAFYLAGLILLFTTLLETFGRRLRVPTALAFLLALTAPLASRAVDLDAVQGRLASGLGGIGADPAQLWFELRGSPEDAPKPGPGGPPIVVISVDTLRADAGRTMASWKRLAARGASWQAAVSSSSWTLPAVASMQTGRPVAEHGAGCWPCQSLSPGVRTLAEDLADRGYRTAAITANWVISRSTGFARGFQTWRDMAGVSPFRLALAGPPAGPPSEDDAVVVDEAVAWLGAHHDPSFYLWVHLLGPHLPYSHASDPEMRQVTPRQLHTGGVGGAAYRARVREAYDESVAYTDRAVGRLLDALEARGILDHGIVVLTSDHGEEFWEHGGTGHGHSLHGEVNEIPLVIAGPGFEAGEHPGVVSLVDLAPTLREIAGIDGPGLDLRSPVPADRIATSYGNLYGVTQRSARGSGERVIGSECGVADETWERFDLASDPGERNPLPVDPSGRVYVAAKTLQAPVAGGAPGVQREALQALGYVQ